MPNMMEDMLEDCLDLMRRGASLQDCLELYPDFAHALEPLLVSSSRAEALLAQPLSGGARRRIRGIVLQQWDKIHAPKRRTWSLPLFTPRWAAMAAALVVALMLGGSGTVFAAGYSVPGDALYPVKQVREEVQLWLTWSPEAKVEMYTSLVNQRADEIRALAAAGRVSSVGIAADRLGDHVTSVSALASQSTGPDRGTSAPSPGMIDRLQSSATAQQAAASIIQNMLDQAPAETRRDLLSALDAITQAQDRVEAAQRALGVPTTR